MWLAAYSLRLRKCVFHNAHGKISFFHRKDVEKFRKLEQKYPECIYRMSDIEPFDGHKVVDSSTRYGYVITTGEWDIQGEE